MLIDDDSREIVIATLTASVSSRIGVMRRINMDISQSRLQEVLEYHKEFGVFTWKVAPRGKKLGVVAGTNNRGYVRIEIDGKIYSAHRLAWLYEYGEFPKMELDHINRVRNDNRIVNLRECDRSINCINKNHPIGASGVLGVWKVKKTGKWAAYIQHQGLRKYLGTFLTKEEAKSAYEHASEIRSRPPITN